MLEMKGVILAFLLCFRVARADIWQTGKSLSGGWYQKELQRIQQVPPHHVTAQKIQHYFLGRPVGLRTKRETINDSKYSWATEKHAGEGRDPQHEQKRSGKISKRSYGVEFYDVAFIIDSSGSIKESDFQNGLKALQILITRAKQSTNYAAISFSEEGHIEFQFQPPHKAIELLGYTKHYGYRTNTMDALKKCREHLFLNRTSGVREGSFRRILVVTDGRSNLNKETTLYEAMELKVLDVEVFVVAVGKYIRGIEELIGIATTRESHLFRVESFGGLIEVVQLIPPWPAIRPNYLD